jgi:hypothetical protein
MTFRIAFVLFLFALSLGIDAAPYIPKSDDEVLETLPYRRGEPALREIELLRSAWSGDPKNVRLAEQLARRYFELAALQGDPRYVGYAQAVLRNWWDMPSPPTPVLVMRATLRQYRHDFSGALQDLTQATERDPQNARAWSLKAVIHAVQADYENSRRACDHLRSLDTELIALACIAFIDGLTGRAREAHDRLKRALERAHDSTREQKAWALTRLAEITWRLNERQAAEDYFQKALTIEPSDTFVLAAYADFLLDYGRADEVIRLLKDRTRADPLLLRLVLAENTLAAKGLREHRSTLVDRYEAARLRGDTTHEQEESRFDLQILKKAQAALELAQNNWKVQREPRDARVLLEAALTLRRPDAAEPALDWIRRSRIEDWYLQNLAEQIERLAKDSR